MTLHKLIPLEEAHRLIDSTELRKPQVVEVPVYEASYRISASDIVAPRSIPERPLAAMDGYALRVEDLMLYDKLRLAGEVKAGDKPPVLGPGEAYYVNMGAPLPEGANAVARVESTRIVNGYIKPLEPLRAGKDVMNVGEVVERGSLVVRVGEIISPYKISVLMMLGFREIPVYDVKVGVLSIGDEIDPYYKPTGKPVIDSIAPMIIGLLRFTNVKYLGVVGDNVGEIRGALEDNLGRLDAIVTIGGASVGESDNVKRVLAEMGELLFPGVAVSILKRGSVAVVDGKPIVTLPGQCVSAVVVLHEFLLHVLSRMTGGELREYLEAELAEDVEIRHRMDTVYLFRVEGRYVKPLKWGVGLCMELVKATGYAILKRGRHERGEVLRLQKLLV